MLNWYEQLCGSRIWRVLLWFVKNQWWYIVAQILYCRTTKHTIIIVSSTAIEAIKTFTTTQVHLLKCQNRIKRLELKIIRKEKDKQVVNIYESSKFCYILLHLNANWFDMALNNLMCTTWTNSVCFLQISRS